MSFKHGTVSMMRFATRQVDKFDQDYVDKLADNTLMRDRFAREDGSRAGWLGGDSCLDADFNLEKNIIGDCLVFDFCHLTTKPPTQLYRAYCKIEEKAFARESPTGHVSLSKKKEARASARERLAEEARDGRFEKRRVVPVLWCGKKGIVCFANSAVKITDHFLAMFEHTFKIKLEVETAATRANQYDNTQIGPSMFVGGSFGGDYAWIPDVNHPDYLGNEFLHWLWYYTSIESDTLTLSDGSDITIMLQRSMKLDCPRGQTGHDTFFHEGPSRMPEAFRAAQSGKVPRQTGMTFVRHDTQFTMSLQAETFFVSTARMPQPEDDIKDARAKLERRIELVLEMDEALDLLYEAFLKIRCGPEWTGTLQGIQKWLRR